MTTKFVIEMASNLSTTVVNPNSLQVDDIITRVAHTHTQITNGTQAEMKLADFIAAMGVAGDNATFSSSILTFTSAGSTLLAHCAAFQNSILILTTASNLFSNGSVVQESGPEIVAELNNTVTGSIGPVSKLALSAGIEDLLNDTSGDRNSTRSALHDLRQDGKSDLELYELPLLQDFAALTSSEKFDVPPNLITSQMQVIFEVAVEIHGEGQEGRRTPPQDQLFIDQSLEVTLDDSNAKLTKVFKTITEHPLYLFITKDE